MSCNCRTNTTAAVTTAAAAVPNGCDDNMNIYDMGGGCNRRPCPPPCHPPWQPPCPPPCPPICCCGRQGPTATNDNAVRIRVAAATVASGGEIGFTADEINSPTGAITRVDASTLSLAAGSYSVTFVSDATAVTGNRAVGAALEDSSGVISGTATLVQPSGNGAARVVINTVLNLAAANVLRVVNNTAYSISYQNSALTVVRLG